MTGAVELGTNPILVLIGLILSGGAGSSLVLGVIGYRQRKKDREAEQPKVTAEVESSAKAGDMQTIAQLTKENERLSTRNDRLEQKSDEQDEQIRKLVDRLDRLDDEGAAKDTRIRHLESEVDRLKAHEEAREANDVKHREWDELAVALIRQTIPPVHLPDPPPLSVHDVPPKPPSPLT